ncbi:MAG: hypothetical protein QHJ73_13980 [Armatimonadota bacterium]|nr:hypothetical protein [Armatimonadota bacterium]
MATASRHPGFSLLIDDEGTCVYRVIARPRDLGALSKLLHMVWDWKHTRCYICGNEVSPCSIWTWLPCYLRRSRSANPACRRPIGDGVLRRLVDCTWSTVWLSPDHPASWYRTFFPLGNRVFKVGKTLLRDRASRWARDYGYCPFAEAPLLFQVIEHLPNTIDVRSDPRWVALRNAGFSIYDGTGSPWLLQPRTRSDYEAFLAEQLRDLLSQKR